MHFRYCFSLLLILGALNSCIALPPPDYQIPDFWDTLQQGRTWRIEMVMMPSKDTTFVTSCTQSSSRHDPEAPAPLNSATNVPNATDVATIFVISEFPLELQSNATVQAQKSMNLSDGTILTSMLTNGTQVCSDPLLLRLVNTAQLNQVSMWWTITETVTVDFYNRLPIYLPPGRTHSIIVNTTRFPNSNMIITETNINNKDRAADIAEIYVNKNQLATPYTHLHNCPRSNTTVSWKGDKLTQYVVVIPPDIYASNVTDQPIYAPHSHSTPDLMRNRDKGAFSLGELEQFAISSWQNELSQLFETPENSLGSDGNFDEPGEIHERPYFFIWIENTSNFTLNYTIKVTQSTQEHVDLVSPPIRYTSPYLFTAFFNFSKQDIIEAMKKDATADDSPDEVELVVDLTTFQETFVATHPTVWLGMDYYPTHLNYIAAEHRATTDNPNKPLLELFLRLHHRFNLSLIPESAVFHLRLDGVSYSPQGFVLQPMIIRPKPIYDDLPFSTNFTGITQEWVLFTYFPEPTPSTHGLLQISDGKTKSIERVTRNTPTSNYRVTLAVDSGMNAKIQAYGGKNSFPTEMKHDWRFERDTETRFVLCEEMDLTHPVSFSLWNPDPNREPIDLFFSFRPVDACMRELKPAKPFPKTAVVTLITMGSILALVLIIFAFYLCAKPTKTEYLTASEEEAARIREMGRSHRDLLNAEAAEYDKVPFLVRDSLYTSGDAASNYLTQGHSIHRFTEGDDEDDYDESDGLIRRPSRHLAAAAFAGDERHTITDDDTIASDTDYY